MRRIMFAVLLSAGALLACIGAPVSLVPAALAQEAPAAKPHATDDNVIMLSEEDKRLLPAQAKARETLPRFEQLRAEKSDAPHAIKFPLTKDGVTEHFWMQVTAHENGRYSGVLANAPVEIKGFSSGDEVSVAEGDIEDWMVMDGELMFGGYTARILLDEAPKEEADAMRARFRD